MPSTTCEFFNQQMTFRKYRFRTRLNSEQNVHPRQIRSESRCLQICIWNNYGKKRKHLGIAGSNFLLEMSLIRRIGCSPIHISILEARGAGSLNASSSMEQLSRALPFRPQPLLAGYNGDTTRQSKYRFPKFVDSID